MLHLCLLTTLTFFIITFKTHWKKKKFKLFYYMLDMKAFVLIFYVKFEPMDGLYNKLKLF
jgi:hypothetical protein